MKILVTGSTGQVGWELCRSLAPLGEVIPAGRSDGALARVDLSDSISISRQLDEVKPQVIVNAAAYTNVDDAERNIDLAFRINQSAPELMAQWARKEGAWLIHYSTDYVFDGSGDRPWREDDRKSPLNVYGESKLAGDEAIVTSGCKYLVFRTSWVYSLRGRNFLKTMMRLMGERDSLRVVDDQVGTPTPACFLADVTAQVLVAMRNDRERQGTYHVTTDGYASWYEFALQILENLERYDQRVRDSNVIVKPVTSGEYSTPARRPKNSRLDTSVLREIFGLSLPHWTVGVDRAVQEYYERASVE